jgi:hypothetical protein
MSGLLSQYLKSRKKAVFVFLTLTLLFVILYFNLNNPEPGVFYLVCALLGFGNGYWALFVTIAAEQFGTNIRSTVATTVPNFVRGSVVPLTLGFQSLKNPLGLKAGALSLGIFVLLIAYLALWRLKESFGKDLDFLEHHESI